MNFQVEWIERIASTNALMRERVSNGRKLRDGLVVAAREQTAGRGRQTRKWLSAPGRDLCCSLFIHTDTELAAVPSLAMAATLAVNDLLRSEGILSAPKWPNDVLVGERKICGILSERVDPAGIIVGIGLNVNMTAEEAEAIDRPATSMLIESGAARDPARVLDQLFQPLEFWIGRWREGGGFQGIREEWTRQAGPPGRPLCVHDGDLRKSGTLEGFGEYGELLLRTNRGVETIWSGDVS